MKTPILLLVTFLGALCVLKGQSSGYDYQLGSPPPMHENNPAMELSQMSANAAQETLAAQAVVNQGQQFRDRLEQNAAMYYQQQQQQQQRQQDLSVAKVALAVALARDMQKQDEENARLQQLQDAQEQMAARLQIQQQQAARNKYLQYYEEQNRLLVQQREQKVAEKMDALNLEIKDIQCLQVMSATKMNINLADAHETSKWTAYLNAAMSPLYNDITSNDKFAGMYAYRKRIMDIALKIAGCDSELDIQRYCERNGINIDDFNKFVNGFAVRSIAFQNTPVSDEVRGFYKAVLNNTASQGASYLNTPQYSNWDNLKPFAESLSSEVTNSSLPKAF